MSSMTAIQLMAVLQPRADQGSVTTCRV